jgi:hypothetical protein
VSQDPLQKVHHRLRRRGKGGLEKTVDEDKRRAGGGEGDQGRAQHSHFIGKDLKKLPEKLKF